MGNRIVSDIEKIESVLKIAAKLELNLDSQYARNFLAKSIKNALDKDDTNDTMEGQLTFNF